MTPPRRTAASNKEAQVQPSRVGERNPDLGTHDSHIEQMGRNRDKADAKYQDSREEKPHMSDGDPVALEHEVMDPQPSPAA